jgi:serine/threonine protein kinase
MPRLVSHKCPNVKTVLLDADCAPMRTRPFGRQGLLDVLRCIGHADRPLGAPMDVGRFLRVAIGIAKALGRFHGLVHKDIKPANILVDGATGEVRLTGFGISPPPPATGARAA